MVIGPKKLIPSIPKKLKLGIAPTLLNSSTARSSKTKPEKPQIYRNELPERFRTDPGPGLGRGYHWQGARNTYVLRIARNEHGMTDERLREFVEAQKGAIAAMTKNKVRITVDVNGNLEIGSYRVKPETLLERTNYYKPVHQAFGWIAAAITPK